MELMRVRVLFFGQLREITGLRQDDAELSEGARLEDLFARYGKQFPKLLEFRASVAASIRGQEIVKAMRAPEDGAAVIFDGFVRNNFRGRETLYLEYEAYEPMALAKITEIGAQIREKFTVSRVAIVHRLGRLNIGETSVFIVVSAPHRAAAFDACRYAIDTLKRTVPIWKKEYFADGSVWAEGQIPAATDNSSDSQSAPK
jgi:molybdopterin synthase catalytic subunit